MKHDYVYATGWNYIMGKPGVALFSFDEESGTLAFVRTLDEKMPIGFTCLDAPNGMIYFVNEINEFGGKSGGGGHIVGCKINDADGAVTQVCDVPTLCPNPSFASLDNEGRYMVVSNHSGTGMATKIRRDASGVYYAETIRDDSIIDLFFMTADHCIGRLVDVAKHEAGPQGEPARPHCAVKSPSGDFFVVCDKGNNGVFTYTIDRDAARLRNGSGSPYQDEGAPRYGAFHPTRPYLFVNHEKTMMIHTFRYQENGGLALEGSISALPEGCTLIPGERYDQQDLQMHPNGRYLYDLVHGPDLSLVTALSVEEDGSLKRLQALTLKGIWPRACAISPGGRHLLVACMESGTIEVCAIGENGCLTQTQQVPWQQGISTLTFYCPKASATV